MIKTRTLEISTVQKWISCAKTKALYLPQGNSKVILLKRLKELDIIF
ncbi:hypothetical protein THOG11_120188 [Vibrio harveyi]|nr:hypothetical protein TH15OA1_410190 [Vibrio harveyi]CAH1553143.1 hypothetical protein THOG11_120188 [Vibrio harveyi]